MNKIGISLFLVLVLTSCKLIPQKTSGPNDSVPSYTLTTRQEIKEVQTLLNKRGFKSGYADGLLGKNTYSAIKKFQRSYGLPVDGKATSTLLHALRSNKKTADKLRHQAEFFSQTGINACITGGGIALAGTLLISKDYKKAMLAALAGCASGAIIDFTLNYMRVDAANEKDGLDMAIDKIHEENNQLKAMIDTSQQLIKEDKQKIKQLQRDIKNNKISKQEVKSQLAELEENRELLKETQEDLIDQQQQWQKLADRSGHSAKVDREIKQLSSKLAELESELDDLDRLRSITVMG